MRSIYLISALAIVFVLSTAAIAQNHANGRSVTDRDAEETALNVGAKMPAFSLSDANGKTVSSSELLEAGNLVVVFYRGAWCPYCNLYLRNLQKALPEIQSSGGQLVAISAESPDRSSTVTKKNELAFTVLSDPGLETGRKFGLVYELPPGTSERYKSNGIDVAKLNSTPKAELPISATYVVKKDGTIVYAFIDRDFKKRAEPSEVVKALRSIDGK